MDIYFLQFEVEPNIRSEYSGRLSHAEACCWIRAGSAENAYPKARFFIEKYGFKTKSVKREPTIVYREACEHWDAGLEQFDRAVQYGGGLFFSAVSSDVSEETQFRLDTPSDPIKPSFWYESWSKAQKKKQCMHHDAGEKCDEIIRAHSIQKSRSLHPIAREGRVYRLNPRVHGPAISKMVDEIGIQKMSTFTGFCKYHDNLVFEPIDNNPFLPCAEHAFLYAYRSICKGLHVKEAALEHLFRQVQSCKENDQLSDHLLGLYLGTKNGCKSLQAAKQRYDKSLVNGDFQDIEYVAFLSEQPPVMSFSGLCYPDFDFEGGMLQDLYQVTHEFKPITFCSAPMETGWAFVLAWHKSDASICRPYISTLAEAASVSGSVSDFLFRLAIKSENLAISPEWWDSLSEKKQKDISEVSKMEADPFENVNSRYLAEGLSSVVDWDFENVSTNYFSMRAANKVDHHISNP